MTYTFKHTIRASYLGYITQAIVVNLSPLLFVMFNSQFHISLEQIGLLISINFGVQIITDLVAARYINRFDTFRIPVLLAHVFAALGLVLLGVLPFVMPPHLGIVIATAFMAIGGGLIEVIISPLVESCPGDEKAAAMSLLHSFYSWGQVGVVLLSTLYFAAFGQNNWHLLPILWALVPAFNVFLFNKVPLSSIVPEGGHVTSLRKLFSVRIFWILLALMIGAGASELAMSQWASLFAEAGLGVSKTLGDLLGPCAFAVLMGCARVFYGIKGSKINLNNFMVLSALMCLGSYALTVFSPSPILSLVGCALCGLAVGIMWPGTISLAAKNYPEGGAAMFAVLALAGDLGCSTGPAIVGILSNNVISGKLSAITSLFHDVNITESGLKVGLMAAMVFPMLIIWGVMALKAEGRKLK